MSIFYYYESLNGGISLNYYVVKFTVWYRHLSHFCSAIQISCKFYCLFSDISEEYFSRKCLCAIITFLFLAQTSQTGYLYNEYDSLREVIVSTGYYGSCGRCETQSDSKYVAHRLASVDDKTPILNGARPLRGGRNINIRVFSLGILFIGGFTIGSYLLYAQGLQLLFHSILHSFHFLSENITWREYQTSADDYTIHAYTWVGDIPSCSLFAIKMFYFLRIFGSLSMIGGWSALVWVSCFRCFV